MSFERAVDLYLNVARKRGLILLRAKNDGATPADPTQWVQGDDFLLRLWFLEPSNIAARRERRESHRAQRHSGTVADARIDAALARDSEVAAAYQPISDEFASIAALTLTGNAGKDQGQRDRGWLRNRR